MSVKIKNKNKNERNLNWSLEKENSVFLGGGGGGTGGWGRTYGYWKFEIFMGEGSLVYEGYFSFLHMQITCWFDISPVIPVGIKIGHQN